MILSVLNFTEGSAHNWAKSYPSQIQQLPMWSLLVQLDLPFLYSVKLFVTVFLQIYQRLFLYSAVYFVTCISYYIVKVVSEEAAQFLRDNPGLDMQTVMESFPTRSPKPLNFPFTKVFRHIQENSSDNFHNQRGDVYSHFQLSNHDLRVLRGTAAGHI